MTKKIIRAGIAGSGFAARLHYDALQRVYGVGVDIVGAYSPKKENLLEFTGPRGLHPFESLEQLIANADMIHICSTAVTHETIVIAALEQHKNVIVEKPFTGYFGDGSEEFNGDAFPKQDGLKHALGSIERMLAAEKKSRGRIM